jgi:hypothetical protein
MTAPAWTDERILAMLHLLDHEHLSRAKVGAILGVGKNAVLGMERRVRLADVRDPEATGDGTMVPGWWVRERPIGEAAAQAAGDAMRGRLRGRGV